MILWLQMMMADREWMRNKEYERQVINGKKHNFKSFVSVKYRQIYVQKEREWNRSVENKLDENVEILCWQIDKIRTRKEEKEKYTHNDVGKETNILLSARVRKRAVS